jgi:hypothetical protein
MWSPSGMYVDYVESMWSLCGVYVDYCGVHVDSKWNVAQCKIQRFWFRQQFTILVKAMQIHYMH